MRQEIQIITAAFLEYSKSDFAYLPHWFGHFLNHYELDPYGFDKNFLGYLVYEGWFLFCSDGVMPKMHQRRCALDLSNWDSVEFLRNLEVINRTKSSQPDFSRGSQIKFRPLKKRLKKLLRGEMDAKLVFNQDYELAVQKTNQFQGYSWIEPDLVHTLADANRNPVAIETSMFQPVSWEVYSDNQLIAADIGYQLGAIYSSMSGFSDRSYSSMGIVQLMATATVLKEMGFKIWDFGMEMQYKRNLGAQCFTPIEYLKWMHQARNQKTLLTTFSKSILELGDFERVRKFIAEKPSK